MAGIFLTGATGLLGSRLLSKLTSNTTQRVVCLVRSRPAERPLGNIEFIHGDLLDSGSYSAAIADCETVVHLAAATGKHSPTDYFRVNRDGTKALLKEAKRARVQQFLYVSTIAVKFSDISRYYYAQSKRQAEAIVTQSGLRWIIVRPTMILGRHAPVFEGLARLARLPVVPVFGDGRALVQPVFMDDLAICLTRIVEQDLFGRRTLEIGGPEVLSIEELLLRIRSLHDGIKARVIHLPARPIATLLAFAEPLLRSLLPITAGQMASFTNAGTIDSDPWVAQQQTTMKRMDEMLHLVANDYATV